MAPADLEALAELAAPADLVAQAESADPVGLVARAGSADPAARVAQAGLADPASPVDLVELADQAELADLANLSGSTDRSTEEMLRTRIRGRPTSLVVGLNSSPHAELVIGRLPELVPVVELEPADPEEEVESPPVRRVEQRLDPVAEVAAGHPRAQLPVVAGTLSAIVVYRRVLVTVLAAARLAAHRAETGLVTTAVEAVVVWAAAVSAVVAAVVAAAVVAAADVEDKRDIDGGKNNENKSKLHDFVETISSRCCDNYFRLSGGCSAGGVRAETRSGGSIAV